MSSKTPSEQAQSQNDPDVERLQERLSFYESFDRLIQDNVAQSGALLREAIELRESASADASHARLQIDEERSAGRERYRALFSAMLDEITTLQGQAERLARRLTDSIDQLELELKPSAEFPHLPANLTSDFDLDAQLPAPDVPEELEESPEDLSAGPIALPPIAAVAIDIGGSATTHNTTELGGSEGEVRPESSDEAAPGLDDQADGDARIPEQAPQNLGLNSKFVLLVHGVPRAATALSLKRHLETLDHVEAVAPREFAAGVLRLQLQVERDLTENDLSQWADGSGLTAIHARPGLLEIQLHN